MLSIVPAGLLAYGVRQAVGSSFPPLLTVVFGGGVLLATYAVVLLYVMGQKQFYVSVWTGMRSAPFAEEKILGRA
jgi:hypothetical protein